MTTSSWLEISALDSWFFRESRPMESVGGSELTSVFPPPPRTVLGALRTAVGEATNVDWGAFTRDKNHSLREQIGFDDDLGPLRLKCLLLRYQDEILFPVPLHLLHKKGPGNINEKAESAIAQHALLTIGDALETRLGRVQLPYFSDHQRGFKPYTDAWITRTGLQSLLQGKLPDSATIFSAKTLFQWEERIGIAIDNPTRQVKDGALFQTRHVRPISNLSLVVQIEHATEMSLPKGWVRLGGEGRLAHFDPLVGLDPILPCVPTPCRNTTGLMLILLSPARFANKLKWLPDNFIPTTNDQGKTIWRGRVNEVSLDIQSAVLGRGQREGGWSLASQIPRAVQSLIPAGSIYYATLADRPLPFLSKAIEKLHDLRIGEGTALGRGWLACGLWNKDKDSFS